MRRWYRLSVVGAHGALAAAALVSALGCRASAARPGDTGPASPTCTRVDDGFGPPGRSDPRADVVVTGLEVPWGIAFLANGEMLVTERPGRVRIVRNFTLAPRPVVTFATVDTAEGGLLGIALHPEFAKNRLFYVYVTGKTASGSENRVERWKLAEDHASASLDRVIVSGIPSAQFHDGGRIRFGADGMLFVGTGDARNPETAQDLDSLSGKLLRLTPDGAIPKDNPFPGKAAFLLGVRNTEGFDWLDAKTLLVTDHGPSGELSRRGHDEVNVAKAGQNLGWPTLDACETRPAMVSPSLTWEKAAPPGGAAVYWGTKIPEWKGSLLIGTLGSKHLHRVAFDAGDPRKVTAHETYFDNRFGRLREVVMGPDGELYVTTSNCDGRGSCPSDKDKILRITR
jgi:glucose/arabinose dehydrogenase